MFESKDGDLRIRTLEPELPFPGIKVNPASVNSFSRILSISTPRERRDSEVVRHTLSHPPKLPHRQLPTSQLPPSQLSTCSIPIVS